MPKLIELEMPESRNSELTVLQSIRHEQPVILRYDQVVHYKRDRRVALVDREEPHQAQPTPVNGPFMVLQCEAEQQYLNLEEQVVLVIDFAEIGDRVDL